MSPPKDQPVLLCRTPTWGCEWLLCAPTVSLPLPRLISTWCTPLALPLLDTNTSAPWVFIACRVVIRVHQPACPEEVRGQLPTRPRVRSRVAWMNEEQSSPGGGFLE